MDALAVVNAVAVLLLVVITGYYAFQTREMVEEMREARRAPLLPKLVLDLSFLGGIYGVVTVQNVGPGPALDVDMVVQFEHAEKGGKAEERAWRDHLMVPGEAHSFHFNDPPGATEPNEWMDIYPFVSLKGHAYDALGGRHEISQRIATRDVLEVKTQAEELLPSDHGEVAAKALEKIAKAADDIRGSVKEISRRLGGR